MRWGNWGVSEWVSEWVSERVEARRQLQSWLVCPAAARHHHLEIAALCAWSGQSQDEEWNVHYCYIFFDPAAEKRSLVLLKGRLSCTPSAFSTAHSDIYLFATLARGLLYFKIGSVIVYKFQQKLLLNYYHISTAEAARQHISFTHEINKFLQYPWKGDLVKKLWKDIVRCFSALSETTLYQCYTTFFQRRF